MPRRTFRLIDTHTIALSSHSVQKLLDPSDRKLLQFRQMTNISSVRHSLSLCLAHLARFFGGPTTAKTHTHTHLSGLLLSFALMYAFTHSHLPFGTRTRVRKKGIRKVWVQTFSSGHNSIDCKSLCHNWYELHSIGINTKIILCNNFSQWFFTIHNVRYTSILHNKFPR